MGPGETFGPGETGPIEVGPGVSSGGSEMGPGETFGTGETGPGETGPVEIGPGETFGHGGPGQGGFSIPCEGEFCGEAPISSEGNGETDDY